MFHIVYITRTKIAFNHMVEIISVIHYYLNTFHSFSAFLFAKIIYTLVRYWNWNRFHLMLRKEMSVYVCRRGVNQNLTLTNSNHLPFIPASSTDLDHSYPHPLTWHSKVFPFQKQHAKNEQNRFSNLSLSIIFWPCTS